MDRNVRKVIAAVSLMSLCIFTAACGDGKVTDEKSKNFFTIGELVSETGQDSEKGNSVYEGTLLAVNEINESGGIDSGDKNYMLKLLEINDEGNFEIAKNGYARLKKKGMDAFVAPISDDICGKLEKMTNEDNLFTIIAASSSDVTGKYDNTFKVCLSDSQEGKEAAEHGFYNANSRNGAVLYPEGENEKAEAFVDEFCGCGGNIVAREVYTDDLDSVISGINNIKVSEAELVYVPCKYDAAQTILELMNGMDMNIAVIGSSQWDGIVTGQYPGLQKVEYLSTYTDKRDRFEETYLDYYGHESDIYSAAGYDAVYVIKEALESSGAVDSDLQISAMTDIEYNGVTGRGISFTEDGVCMKEINFETVWDGGNQ